MAKTGPQRRLSDEQFKDIARLRSLGWTRQELANEFGVSNSTIARYAWLGVIPNLSKEELNQRHSKWSRETYLAKLAEAKKLAARGLGSCAIAAELNATPQAVLRWEKLGYFSIKRAKTVVSIPEKLLKELNSDPETRRALVITLRNHNYTYKAIGDALGVSRQRAEQLCLS